MVAGQARADRWPRIAIHSSAPAFCSASAASSPRHSQDVVFAAAFPSASAEAESFDRSGSRRPRNSLTQPFRGEPAIDRKALAERGRLGLARGSAEERPDVASVDLNPLIVSGADAPIAVDALVELAGRRARPPIADCPPIHSRRRRRSSSASGRSSTRAVSWSLAWLRPPGQVWLRDAAQPDALRASRAISSPSSATGAEVLGRVDPRRMSPRSPMARPIWWWCARPTRSTCSLLRDCAKPRACKRCLRHQRRLRRGGRRGQAAHAAASWSTPPTSSACC